jgi:hypothetical protein
MESINGHNVACCNVPPVVTEGGMELKGKYETIGDIKTCKSIAPFHGKKKFDLLQTLLDHRPLRMHSHHL